MNVSDYERWRVECDCGYGIEGLPEQQAARFADQHGDDEHDPRVVMGGDVMSATAWLVHDHGPNEGRGLDCPERRLGPNRVLVGACRHVDAGHGMCSCGQPACVYCHQHPCHPACDA